MDYLINEYVSVDTWLLCDEDDSIRIPTSKGDPSCLEFMSVCENMMRTSLLLACDIDGTKGKPCDGKKGEVTCGMFNGWVD